MSNAERNVVLRYFDCRGRAQFIRDYLRVREIPHVDERVPLSGDFKEWAAMRADRALTGPFHKLPVLHWEQQMVAETLVIRTFLHAAAGDEVRLSSEDNLRHAMLASSAYNDLMLPIGILLWADIGFVGIDLGALCDRTLERLQMHMASLDRTLQEWRWLDGLAKRPVMLADCLLWEELDAALTIFRDRLKLEAAPVVADFYRNCPGRGVFASMLEEQPRQITGRPKEQEALASLHAHLQVGG